MNMITVYHGSNVVVNNPSLTYGRDDADFGSGFYVTREIEMAEKWAARKNNSIINVYEIDLDNINGIEFGIDKGWLDFVVQNRSGNKRMEIDLTNIDYIMGATADDRLFAIIEQYEENLIEVDTAIRAMNAMKIGNQISLISEYGISNLKFNESYVLSPERKVELKQLNIQMRKKTNEIVEMVLKNRMKEKNAIPAPQPVIHKKRS
ncbi:MAG: DUF3990 domain-containing protein [Eubacteriales bacterium]